VLFKKKTRPKLRRGSRKILLQCQNAPIEGKAKARSHRKSKTKWGREPGENPLQQGVIKKGKWDSTAEKRKRPGEGGGKIGSQHAGGKN